MTSEHMNEYDRELRFKDGELWWGYPDGSTRLLTEKDAEYIRRALKIAKAVEGEPGEAVMMAGRTTDASIEYHTDDDLKKVFCDMKDTMLKEIDL